MLANALKLGVGLWVTRLLDPKDFALLAIVLAIQGFVVSLTGFNMSSELVRARKIDSDDIAVSWTCEAIRNVSIWFVILLLAPVASDWLGRPDATFPLRVSASVLLISLLVSPRLVELRREGRFGLLGMIEGVAALGQAIVTVILVLVWKNYWALIVAAVAMPMCQAIVSHILVPWKPRFYFDKKRASPMARFGMVLLVMTWIMAAREHGLIFMMTQYVRENDIGYYNRALTFSYSLAIVVSGFFWRIAYPVYARCYVEGTDVLKEVLKNQKWIAVILLPILLITILNRTYLIKITLGEKWLPIADLWAWLVVAGALLLATAPFEAAFQASRREMTLLLICGASAAVQLLTAWLLLPLWGLTAAGVAMVTAVAFSLVCFQVTARMSKTTPEERI